VTETSKSEPEEKYHWVVWFRQGGRLYTYLHRTVEDMTSMVEKHYAEHATYPYRMWVIVDGEIQKVVIE